MDNRAFLSLGTNLGDRFSHLQEAIRLLDAHEKIRIERVSSIYETDPVGYTEQPAFLNLVLQASTSLSAEELLEACLLIEQQLGRVREFKWGPRVIDLDILMYNQDNIKSENLIIPHPRMLERAFVLIPLAEVAPKALMPGSDQSLEDLVSAVQGREGVRLWKQADEENFLI
ncbi:2-amino-4-hydroxy-6-hydroxymethyldihydropteridine diphosphokinase [Bacillus thermotolerans]|uniref:2-amino-4-hydroxy-6-hydroxymethyldihydropteridine diphosphokinase n=1 Tax=Bacillus thermotolerans TaxID=1221996 RepID=A0A0F5I2C1_BACTR|nr:2-amino-4-hydroxy-6-hydroxymethyldihydropteridine diphosphokinase [Bacillus thermotolerans]KKB39425.1 2-amino-4-hydroxy-6-hydroxymethyldihydropteridine pyrophosphokinase [Bacillus thermotolerans]KKB39732.1 2-amino-4-hydroxy-6-hydroxymethyldihydropteridine pyrophosphokinase [Bacillus thermotolerans]